MNFQNLGKVESASFYLDVAFRQASNRVAQKRGGIRAKDELSKQKNIELMRMEMIKSRLAD